MNSLGRALSCSMVVCLLAGSVSHAQEAPGYGDIRPILIQKDKQGRLSREAAELLAGVMEEIDERGELRAWVEADTRYRQMEPTDPAYSEQLRRIRAIQQRIVANLTSAMSELSAAEIYPSEGPFVAVTVNQAGARTLIADRDVSAICFLVPAY